MNTEELNITYNILDSLEHNPILVGKYNYVLNPTDNNNIKLNILNHTINTPFYVRTEVRAQHLPRIINSKGIASPLLLAQKIYPDARHELVMNDIQYIEGNGNIYLHDENFYILINTNKTNVNTKISAGRAFTKTGLKIIFNILLDERLLTMPYRQISETTGVSLGNVTNILNALRVQNFIINDTAGKPKLNNKKQLIEKWVDNFEHVLKPAIEIGRFRFQNENDRLDWRRMPLDSKRSVWGGEPAGNLMTGTIKPTTLTIYSNETRNELANNYRIIRDPDGDIKVYGKFWEFNRYKNSYIAPPLLVYADLINSMNTNNHKVAAEIFDNVLSSV